MDSVESSYKIDLYVQFSELERFFYKHNYFAYLYIYFNWEIMVFNRCDIKKKTIMYHRYNTKYLKKKSSKFPFKLIGSSIPILFY